MNFSFPEHLSTHFDTIKYFEKEGKNISYQDIDPLTPLKNQINIKNIDYYFRYISDDNNKNKGGNSIILRLYESQFIDIDNIEYGRPDLVIKILKNKANRNPEYKRKSQIRFEKEITALKKCDDKNFQNIVKIFESGYCRIYNPNRNHYEDYIYYTMEYADYDLKKYIEENHNILLFENKLALCLSICEGIRELDILDYYHRDIKPDNIFMIDNDWKIGDLGLLAERNLNFEIDEEAEPIGPRGWMSPESMNKYLTEGKNFNYKYDCVIDHQSDIFQLGKVFWYIFQHNSPIGSITEKDFKINESIIYPILRTMLNHSKKRRYKRIEEIIYLIKKIESKVLKS
jgi:serine/threonine protein kinase